MKGNLPYFHKKFADPIKSVVDKVVDAKKSQRIAWEVLTQGGTITRNTLYGQIQIKDALSINTHGSGRCLS